MRDWEAVKELRWRAPGGILRPFCAGSGLARVAAGFWAIADDLNHVVFFPDGNTPGRGHRIFPGEPPKNAKQRKRVKKDLESLIDLGDGRLLAFPSGSKNRRCRGSLIELDACGRFKGASEIDFRPLMELLDDEIPDLNIEGGFVSRRNLVLLQRGNGRSGLNAAVKIRLKAFLRGMGKGRWRSAALRINVKRMPLGLWDGVALCFTDGFYYDGAAYFATAAEAGRDTVRDGNIVGSALGVIRRGSKPRILSRLKGEKIEGLALKSEKNGLLEIYAVTDADVPDRSSQLLRTWIQKSE